MRTISPYDAFFFSSHAVQTHMPIHTHMHSHIKMNRMQ
uniref:Uncharacterized protein n=1 Tax=Setaria italica TaxID=4555 RepID=K4AP76_SETIT